MADADESNAAKSTPDPDAKPTTDKLKATRPSHAVRERKSEKFREKKNEKTMEKLTQKLERTKLSFGYTSAELFGDRVLASATKPPLRVEITTSFAAELIKESVSVLHYSCKLSPPAGSVGDEGVRHDFITLLNATAHQLSAKFYFANLKSKYARISDALEHVQHMQTSNLLNRAITPMAVFIDQIGCTEFDGQKFHPTADPENSLTIEGLRNPDNHLFSVFPELRPTTQAFAYPMPQRLNFRGLPMDFVFHSGDHVSQATATGLISDGHLNTDMLYAMSELQIQAFGRIAEHVVTDAVLPFREVCERYINFLGRVERKLQSTAIVDLNIESGRGCNSQLVGNRRINSGGITCSSSRNVTDDACVMSAMLRLGHSTDEPLYDAEIAVKQIVVDATASAVALAHVLVRKVKV